MSEHFTFRFLLLLTHIHHDWFYLFYYITENIEVGHGLHPDDSTGSTDLKSAVLHG